MIFCFGLCRVTPPSVRIVTVSVDDRIAVGVELDGIAIGIHRITVGIRTVDGVTDRHLCYGGKHHTQTNV